jgi:hypothetical protein
MVDLVSIAVATGSFVISIVTLYITYLKRGNLRLTKPTAIFFTRDGSNGRLKIVVTALLYSTAKRGHVVESMFVRFLQDGSMTTFSEWIYWEGDRVHLGGVKIGEEGRTLFDHFLLPDRTDNFDFTQGKYLLEICAQKVGAKAPIRLFKTEFSLDARIVESTNPGGPGFALLWNPDTQSYRTQIGPPRSHNVM